ncbi:MAG: hypothetical protein QNJ51_11605 [Calothrix sp. MO_167.B12]|nr:hypothetical protein [Calothrix sp. MO_167.B12]
MKIILALAAVTVLNLKLVTILTPAVVAVTVIAGNYISHNVKNILCHCQ